MLPMGVLNWITFIVKHAGPLVILVVGCICVVSLQRVGDLRSTPLFAIVRVLMIIDIVNIAFGKIHDIPDEILDREAFGPIFVTIILITQCIRWFAQLLALPMLSGLHFMSLYKPVNFRKLRLVHGYAVVAIFLSMSIILTIPLLTACCGFTYYVQGAFWSFDFEKPGTALYNQLNLVLQSSCVMIMLICDAFILYKVYKLRPKDRIIMTIKSVRSCLDTTQQTPASDPSALTNTPRAGAKAPARRNRQSNVERKLTMSFLLLSLSFILPTIGFNMRPYYQQFEVAGLIGALCLVVEYSKWFVYALTTTSIRREFILIIRCKISR